MGLFKRKPQDPEIERVYKDTYQKTYREERLKRVEERAKKAAKAKANAKPFYQKLMGLGDAVAKDLSGSGKKKGRSGVSMLEEMAFGTEPKRKRKRRKK